ncbi:MAG: dimethyl sulfoxide reductase anchor subunit [Ectothiorhodospiraceae bacterium]|nr:dimethyl sulfoxide reductase anchor subunit [Ectothiorhodospiraceae bacterium]
MQPAWSVIFFTVASGAGFGLVILTVFLGLFGGVHGLGTNGTAAAVIIGMVLAAAGLLASTLHLANPRNAWRAFFRFRTSWLSREAVFAVLFYPVSVLYLVGIVLSGDGAWFTWVGAIGIVVSLLAVATVFATGMIYASLRTIPQWNSALVPVNYLLLALASGALLLTAIVAMASDEIRAMALLSIVLLAIAGAAKATYYFWIGMPPSGPSIHTALALTRGQVRLLEAGQSHDTFLNREFSFQASAKLLVRLRLIVYATVFVIPFVLMAAALHAGHPMLAPSAALFMAVGLVVERWLFFAEARHTVNLFYGRQTC